VETARGGWIGQDFTPESTITEQTAAAQQFTVGLRPVNKWAALASLIEREYGETISLTTVGCYLKAWGMTTQKPVRRAHERNDVAIKRRLVAEYPVFIEFIERLMCVPGDCPEPNPDELLDQVVKTNALGGSRPTNKAEMIATVRSHLHRRQKRPRVIRNLFVEKRFRYDA